MAGAGNWVVYNDYLLAEGVQEVKLNTDALKVALFTSASIAINKFVNGATYTAFAADGNEVANGNGYTTGGESVPTVTYTGGAGNPSVLAGGAVAWTGSGSGFTARAAVLYDNTSTTKRAIAYCLLDSTPADYTVASGDVLTLNVNTGFTKSSS